MPEDTPKAPETVVRETEPPEKEGATSSDTSTIPQAQARAHESAAAEAPEGEVAQVEKRGPGRPKGSYCKKLTDNHDAILAELENCVYISDLAKKYNVRWHTMSGYIHDTPDLEQAYQDGRNALIESYEKRLHELAFREQELVETDSGDMVGQHDGKVMATNFNAVKFFLERQAADRGYGAKIETKETGFGGGLIPIIMTGDMSEEAIAEAEAKVRAANEAARLIVQ